MGLLVANLRTTDGKWSFVATAVSWRVAVKQHLGANAGLLKGCKRVARPDDTRLCIRAPTREAQLALYAAIRRTRTLRVFSVLTPTQLEVRNKAQQFAAHH